MNNDTPIIGTRAELVEYFCNLIRQADTANQFSKDINGEGNLLSSREGFNKQILELVEKHGGEGKVFYLTEAKVLDTKGKLTEVNLTLQSQEVRVI